ncbi:MAG TPA: hypothetical protein VJN93_00350 [Candidatus Acidoferrum sp.]|nr:hypothetical protein [Candidatus Acidoferrum sp.]
MEPRVAFTAEHWGEHAVVCRAVEGCPGPLIEQQFGEFDSWAQAHAFALKLNEGLDLDQVDVQQIVASSYLAATTIVRAGLDYRHPWASSRVGFAAHSAHFNFTVASLTLARTYCECARNLPSRVAHRLLGRARCCVIRAWQCMTITGSNDREMKELFASIEALNAHLRTVPEAEPAA